jgi:gliding motility-associated-like protein
VKSGLLIGFCFVFATAVKGQEFVWAKRFGNPLSSLDIGWSVATTPTEEIYVVGEMDTINMDGSDLGAGLNDGFLAKFDSSGQKLWAMRLGSDKTGRLGQAASDPKGNLFVWGTFRESLVFGKDTLKVKSWLGQDCFVAKYDPSGNPLWIRMIPDESLPGVINTDREGNLYVLSDQLPAFNSQRCNLFKFNTDGELMWKTLVISGPQDGGTAIAIDDLQRPVVAGDFFGTRNFGDDTLTSSGISDGFVAKFNSDGTFRSVIQMGGDSPVNPDQIVGLTLDGFGGFYVTGAFADSTVLARYDSADRLLWSVKQGAFEQIWGCSVQLDEVGNVFVVGDFGGTMVYGNHVLTNDIGSLRNIFLLKFDRTGNIIWAVQSRRGYLDHALSLSRAPSGNLYITGDSSGEATSYGNIVLPRQGQNDLILAKIHDGMSVPLVLNLGGDTTICERGFTLKTKDFAKYVWQDGSSDSAFSVIQPGKYFVAATDRLGRTQSDTVNVEACLDTTIPNVITPNGDEYNQRFVIPRMDITKNNVFLVFDRWGKKVYSSNNYQNDWDGGELSPGVYYYELVEAKTHKVFKGWVQLLR